MEELLPAAGSSPRCADHTRQLGLDPGGTAIAADVLVLVETPLPWPKPVFGHELLSGVESIPAIGGGTARVLAVVPTDPDPPHRVITYWRRGAATLGASHRIASASDLASLVAELRSDDGEVRSLADGSPVPHDAVLVCTQGSHDVCCGTDGMRLATELRSQHDDLDVFRVSHTGGHRFAPTAMTLPDGRMWAHLDLDLLVRIRRRGPLAADIVDRCRGWWGAPAGPAQVAERATFAELGWDIDDRARSVEVEPLGPGAWSCTVRVAGRPFSVAVTERRQVPTISCRSPGGLPAKPATEYEARLIG